MSEVGIERTASPPLRRERVIHPNERGSAGQQFIDWLDVAGQCWRRRMTVVGCALAGAVSFAVVTMFLPNEFVAVSELLLDPRELQILQNNVRPQAPTVEASATYAEDQARVLLSTDLLLQVIRDNKLTNDPEFAGGVNFIADRLNELMGRSSEVADKGESKREREVLKELNKRFSVDRSARSMVLAVAVRSNDPNKSARISNSIVEAYLDVDARARSGTASRASQELSDRLTELRERLRGAEEKVERFRRSAGIVAASGRDVGEDQLTALNALLSAAKGQTAAARSRLDSLSALGSGDTVIDSLPDTMRSTTLGSLVLQLSALKQQAAELAGQLGSQHPQMKALCQRTAQIEGDIRTEVRSIRRGVEAAYKQAQRNERDLTDQVNALKARTLNLNEETVKLRELQRESDASRAIYEAFLLRSRETGESTSVSTSNVRVITKATPPLERASPNRTLITAGGGMLGLFGSLLFIAAGAVGRRSAGSQRTEQGADRTAADPLLAETGLRDVTQGSPDVAP